MAPPDQSQKTDPTEQPPGRLPDCQPPPDADRPPEAKLQRAATKLIDRIGQLEAGRNGEGDGFDAGAWWGKTPGPVAAKVETLAQLGIRLEAGDRPEDPWAYCQSTYREKEADYHAGRAEATSAARLKAEGRNTG